MSNINHAPPFPLDQKPLVHPIGWIFLYHPLSPNHGFYFLLQFKFIFQQFYQLMNLRLMQRILPLHNFLVYIMGFPLTKASIQSTNFIFVVYLCVIMMPMPHTLSGTIKNKSYTTLGTPKSYPIEVATPLSSCHNKSIFGELSCTLSKF